jgi:hypothetical protein
MLAIARQGLPVELRVVSRSQVRFECPIVRTAGSSILTLLTTTTLFQRTRLGDTRVGSGHYNTLIDVALNFSPFRRDYPASSANQQTAECLFHTPFDDRGKKTRHRSVQRYPRNAGWHPSRDARAGSKYYAIPESRELRFCQDLVRRSESRFELKQKTNHCTRCPCKKCNSESQFLSQQ